MEEYDFIQFLDCLMWEGYAEQYRETHPADYYNEFIEFLNLHSNGKESYNQREAAAA